MNHQSYNDYYLQAQKLARKEQRQRVQIGQNPYLQVLDELLAEGMAAGETDLGLLEIPVEKIVGTRTSGRTNAFAANFMPLLPEDSEFARKWCRLCEAHLSDEGIRDAVSFVTHDGLASALIINGEVQYQNLASGVNPRTAIGQREDGAVLLLVLDGRSINTLGATMENICDVMLEYGAVNAGNLDDGSSSVMVYEGEIINSCASVTGPRNIPTGFIVLQEGNNG